MRIEKQHTVGEPEMFFKLIIKHSYIEIKAKLAVQKVTEFLACKHFVSGKNGF